VRRPAAPESRRRGGYSHAQPGHPQADRRGLRRDRRRGQLRRWNPTIRASRQLDAGEIGEGTRFEWDLRGFGKVVQELRDFDRLTRVRIIPHIDTLEGGHRFRLTAQGGATRVDH
jgi:hypothetical protein